MTGRLAGRVALVTGAASGIGAATVELMLREGAHVLATDIDAERGEALCARLAERGEQRILFARRDVRHEPDWESAITLAAERLGPLDVLVNNAGVIPAIVPLAQTSLDEWRRVIAVNLDGVFLGVKHAIRAMTGRGGAIVNVSSAAGLVGMPLNGAYGAAKAGVLMLTKCAALECAQLDPPIRVNAVHPGYIATGMTEAISDTLGSERFEQRVRKAVPLRRLGEPADIAEAIVFLACDQSKFVTGSSVVVDGGWTAQ
jgi:3(or 17)beta-hydroxysteroid dehydrogenase